MMIIAQGCLLSWFYGFYVLWLLEWFKRKGVFWVDRKTCRKKRIATDLYYHYGEIDYKINASLATAYELYIKRYSKKYTFTMMTEI